MGVAPRGAVDGRAGFKAVSAPPASPKKRKAKAKEVFVEDKPRYLTRNPGMVRRDYTDNPSETDAREVPEPVTGDALADIQARARANFNVLHAEQQARRELRSLKAKLSEAQARALKLGVDCAPVMDRIRAEIEGLQAQLDRAA